MDTRPSKARHAKTRKPVRGKVVSGGRPGIAFRDHNSPGDSEAGADCMERESRARNGHECVSGPVRRHLGDAPHEPQRLPDYLAESPGVAKGSSEGTPKGLRDWQSGPCAD